MNHFFSLLRLFPGRNGSMTVNWSLQIITWFYVLQGSGVAQSFIRMDAGTKSNIREIIMTPDGHGYFLTDKVYTLEGDGWKKVDYPVSGPIGAFNAISADDIWFSASLETSTSMLYHYHDGITENIHTPFANDIHTVLFASPHLGFFTSYSEIVIYDHGVFMKINPVPARGYIPKAYGMSAAKFWVLSQLDELFVVENGKFLRIFPDRIIRDFQFTDAENGYVLCNDAILGIHGLQITTQYRSPLFRNARKICVRNKDELWVVGDNGLILVQQNGVLRQVQYDGKENLNSLAFSGKNEIWIAGANGIVLYSGVRKFPVYNERYPGFSAQKLIYYGVNVDNEYGVAFADFNGDDKTDIYAVCISDPDRLFINKTVTGQYGSPEIIFREEAVKRGASGLTQEKNTQVPSELKLGVAVADVDNDGDEDIYLSSLNCNNKMLLNNGEGFFRNVSEQQNRACEDLNRSNASAFADVDLDGDLDLFVTSEQGSDRLYLNDGNGYFTDVTRSAGVSSEGGGMCASFSDVNADGYPDLCVTFWYPSNKIYLNETRNGKVKFRDITLATDLAKSEPAKSNAVVFADVNNDGHPDLFIANRHALNRLYLNDGKGIFRDVTTRYFDDKVFLTNGAVFADFDLDGFQDLYITNVGENVMYKNMGGKYFEEVTGKFGTELSGYCTGCAVGDIDNDGDVDLYAANYINGSSVLFLNKMEKKNAVTFRLKGTWSNRNAIGATISLFVEKPAGSKDSLAGFREINGGSGYGSVSAKEAVFGLNPGMNYYAVVRFPASGGEVKINRVKAGGVIRVSEQTGFIAYKTLSQKALARFFSDPETRREMAKYLAVLLILLLYLRFQRKGSSRVAVLRWILCLAIFILFALVNQFFLFNGSVILFLISPVLAIFCLVILHLVTERILLKRMAENEKWELREKISRDLHDDLASTLGSISIYASTLNVLNDPAQQNFRKLTVKISELTHTALQSITDIIWMTAPRHDSLQSLLSKVSAMMLEVLPDNRIGFDEQVELPDHEIILHDRIRHDTFLIMKEALNNTIRHADAHHVTLKAWMKDHWCFVHLSDDGKGFIVKETPDVGSHGNGLVNMRRRASESGINFQLQSVVGSGTRIEISFKI